MESRRPSNALPSEVNHNTRIKVEVARIMKLIKMIAFHNAGKEDN
jgi:hypothetical protein